MLLQLDSSYFGPALKAHMSLGYYVKPDSSPSNKPPQVEDTNSSGFALRSPQIFNNSVRYLQRTLLGFDADADNTHLALLKPNLLPWKEQRQVLTGDTNNFVCHGQPSTLEITGSESLFQTPPKHRQSVDHLPVELLQEIFSYLLPGRDWRLDCSPPPHLVLVQICTYWRSIALSYPRLWATFMIVHPIKRHIPMTKLFLERSGQHPLTLCIDHVGLERGEALTTTDIVIDLLRPHAHRWKAAIFVLQSGVQSSLLTLPRDEFPLLETFCFDVTCYERFWGLDDVERVEKIFLPLSSPKLSEFTWKTYGLSLHKPPLIPTSVTYLSGDFPLVLPFFEALSNLENLHTLHLYQCEENPSFLDKPVVLSRLHTLDLRIASRHMQFFLDLIYASELKVLFIGRPLPEDAQNALCNFVQRSRCYLNAFTYVDPSGNYTNAEFLKNLLLSPQMKFLMELNIFSEFGDTGPLMRLLAVEKYSLPSLNRLWILARHCSGDFLVHMLQCRGNKFFPPCGNMMSEPLFYPDFLSSFSGLSHYSPESAYSLRIQFQHYYHYDEALYSYYRPHWKFDF
ncbi:hypothetical protein DFH05DRAFT_911795 [Lentinula detonsa]|uniref:F-box domain-containing protein n=1 Tax=Lentinula detonsa TaxID=2804962 RepID=A0A9W8P3R4_9AGAR|nr:hypothetical protein DFH05DRAFT_911795 [Lentinula detonsa]